MNGALSVSLAQFIRGQQPWSSHAALVQALIVKCNVNSIPVACGSK
jgi:hypothetical protein